MGHVARLGSIFCASSSLQENAPLQGCWFSNLLTQVGSFIATENQAESSDLLFQLQMCTQKWLQLGLPLSSTSTKPSSTEHKDPLKGSCFQFRHQGVPGCVYTRQPESCISTCLANTESRASLQILTSLWQSRSSSRHPCSNSWATTSPLFC